MLSSRWLQPGAYEKGNERLALNRPAGEDMARILGRDEIDTLLAGLDVQHVNQSLSTAGALTSEIWRAVLVVMALALIIEALLCMPEPKSIDTVNPGDSRRRAVVASSFEHGSVGVLE